MFSQLNSWTIFLTVFVLQYDKEKKKEKSQESHVKTSGAVRQPATYDIYAKKISKLTHDFS